MFDKYFPENEQNQPSTTKKKKKKGIWYQYGIKYKTKNENIGKFCP